MKITINEVYSTTKWYSGTVELEDEREIDFSLSTSTTELFTTDEMLLDVTFPEPSQIPEEFGEESIRTEIIKHWEST